MHDAGAVRRVKCAGNLNRRLDRFHQADPAAGKPSAQRQAIDKLSGDVRSRPILFDFENRQDVGMIEGGRGPRLLNKATHASGISGEVLGENFQSNGAFQFDIRSLINLAHAAGTDVGADFVTTESSSRSEVHTKQTDRTGSEWQSSTGQRKVN